VIWLAVALGGAIGTMLRFALARVGEQLGGATMPWWTFAVNVVGSFALGVVAVALSGRTAFGLDLRIVLGTGVLGGFTTYSTFNLETLQLVERGLHGRAIAYVAGTVLCALVLGYAGMKLGARLQRE
jgi:CrcB protein